MKPIYSLQIIQLGFFIESLIINQNQELAFIGLVITTVLNCILEITEEKK